MAKVLFNLPDQEHAELKKKATSLGLTTSAYIRQILRDSPHKKSRPDSQAVSLAIRRLIPVLAQALGRTQNADRQAIEKLTQILLKEYDQGGG
jgi:plasmid stability protein